MSQRYTDHNPSNSWNDNNNRNSRHSSHDNRHSKQNGNPIGKWIQKRRRHRNNSSSSTSTPSGPVGTEARALQNIQRNAQHFHYPSQGFVTPVEHSLLYAMIQYPELYPESAVRKEIEEEEFDVYLEVRDDCDGGGGDGRKATTTATTTTTTTTTTDSSLQPARESYAQLSALLALSAEKNPAKATPEQSERSSNNSNTSSVEPSSQQLSIGQILCRKILRTITQYSDAHSLDRNHEIRELLNPVEKRCQLRNEQAALKQLLPAYAGYTLSLMTGNPLPLLIGAAALTGKDPMMEENTNVSGFRGMGGRTGNLETAGLLDECEDE
ncbi:predicted protein [Thalassiosira pseudonana CCMP1335]|uniref:Uncharacterized protein n=1 Tax=Thalassiosira pseudonana TaxID=35128 RepID=B8LDV6_THAPS|nr:predicted protein [Thalassiosira pseudonana CCMP1335]EED86549.1 predicted protein [Thalassiosira pseudonana CCMP1335]